jgi:phage shock protein C
MLDLPAASAARRSLMAKRMYRSRENSMIAGVCGGIGEYFDVDPVFIRIIAVLLLFAKGVGLIAYIVAWIAMPQRPEDEVVVESRPSKSEFAKYLPGVILIALGIVFLADRVIWWFDFGHIWPLGLIAIGVFLIARAVGDKKDTEEGTNESVES